MGRLTILRQKCSFSRTNCQLTSGRLAWSFTSCFQARYLFPDVLSQKSSITLFEESIISITLLSTTWVMTARIWYANVSWKIKTKEYLLLNAWSTNGLHRGLRLISILELLAVTLNSLKEFKIFMPLERLKMPWLFIWVIKSIHLTSKDFKMLFRQKIQQDVESLTLKSLLDAFQNATWNSTPEK